MYINLFDGDGIPGNTIKLLKYNNRIGNPPNCPARKYCYIISSGDLQNIFDAAGVRLDRRMSIKNSNWNRRQPVENDEYGVEICEDDNGDPNTSLNPVYLVYDHHWFSGKGLNTPTQHEVYSNVITEVQAINLDRELRQHDIP